MFTLRVKRDQIHGSRDSGNMDIPVLPGYRPEDQILLIDPSISEAD